MTIKQDEIILSIDNTATHGQIEEFKQQLSEKNITLTIDKIERDSSNHISRIKISVDCHDGFKGSYSKTLLDNSDAVGFYRIYRKDSISPFGMHPIVEE